MAVEAVALPSAVDVAVVEALVVGAVDVAAPVEPVMAELVVRSAP
ncbi:hypothetical protein [Nannocystis punicea]|uniref:Uncharacterized protein n=1 Tax=Nannocystis punicea TaxID=2995304 RepID=A0ABY7GTC2_9BACT|nr:hypothetical protein [Nannocystis poenicansa]WAS90209.1 hypothetical protein O0S08_28780 [Nannocystis poenicansa]